MRGDTNAIRTLPLRVGKEKGPALMDEALLVVHFSVAVQATYVALGYLK